MFVITSLHTCSYDSCILIYMFTYNFTQMFKCMFTHDGISPHRMQKCCYIFRYSILFYSKASCRNNDYMGNNRKIMVHTSHRSIRQLQNKKVRCGRFHFHICHIFVIYFSNPSFEYFFYIFVCIYINLGSLFLVVLHLITAENI